MSELERLEIIRDTIQWLYDYDGDMETVLEVLYDEIEDAKEKERNNG
jgi:hypothetical protein